MGSKFFGGTGASLPGTSIVYDPFARCSNCKDGGDIRADTSTGDFVCLKCGFVDGGRIAVFCYSCDVKTRISIYRRIHHVAERITQWTCVEPPIPKDLQRIIRREAKKAKYERGYSRETVFEILRNVAVPPKLQEKYRSAKFKQQPLTNLRRFYEKWRSIQAMLTKKRSIDLPSPELVEKVRSSFLELQPGFEMHRHTAACDKFREKNNTRLPKCHKQFKCRYNIPHLNFMFLQLIRKHGGDSEAERWKHVFYQISKSKQKKLHVLYNKMADYAGWNGVKKKAVTARRKLQAVVSKSLNKA